MVLYGTIDSLIDFFSFTAWIFYGGAMVALIVMRYTKPNYPRPYKVSRSAPGCRHSQTFHSLSLFSSIPSRTGPTYHSNFGYGHFRLPCGGSHHREAANRVPVRSAVHTGWADLLRTLRALRLPSKVHG